MHRSVGPRVAVLLVTVLALGACGTSTPPAPRTPEPAPPAPTATIPAAELGDLTVEVRQTRSDWAARIVQLRVVNDGPAPFVVQTGTLRTPHLEGVARSDPRRSRSVPAGRARDFSVQLGTPVCGGAEVAAGRGPVAEVVLEVTDERGRSAEIGVDVSDPQGHLDRIHGEDCARLAVAEGVRLEPGATIAVEEVDGRVVGIVELTAVPVPDGPEVAITQVDGSILLAPVGAHSWSDPALRELPPQGATTRLQVRPGRCDPHAVAEDKRGTFFGIHATVDGVPQPVFYLDVDTVPPGGVHDFVARSCGW